MEQGAHTIAGVEAKLANTVTPVGYRGLRRLAKASGARFVRGIVLYDGELCAGFGNWLHAVPLKLLWNTSWNTPRSCPKNRVPASCLA